MDRRTLVENHVLYPQSTVVEELIQCGKLDCESLYDTGCEVLEWWLVSDWLTDKLRGQGEVIIDDYGCCWWGRTTSGQAVYMDGVMAEICGGME
ncbi:hypothetical protein [uncultured Rikenella sp.]|uniref:hypothetical protein n=1 Tax=uncultured Rikenella sp. TaxID=368003 RepID=UPI0026316D68|nr:hypothetical protein [uncultured Rikenella sp.]